MGLRLYTMKNTLLLLIILFGSNLTRGQDQYRLLGPIKNHYQTIVNHGRDHYGDQNTPVWMSSLDPSTHSYPADDQRPAHIPARVYLDRSVDAPKGATLYWDLPDLATAYNLSYIFQDSLYWQAANDYVNFFLQHCRANNGVILWGNHYFYDAFQDTPVRFKSSENPEAIDLTSEKGDLHEMRPLSAPWDILWSIDSVVVEQHIRVITSNHLVDETTGEFNRHADNERGYAFLEYGGILAYTLSWLYQKTGDQTLLEQADKIIEFSYGFRNPTTGLIENSPTQDRWDKYASTTEIGLWANYILKAADLAPENYSHNWIEKADQAISDWIRFGYDPGQEMFHGALNVADGKPIKRTDDYPYRPDNYSNIWNPLFPTHNYPMQFAESCLKLYSLTKKPIYQQGCQLWLSTIAHQFRDRDREQLIYAENYARVLHYLLGYQKIFGKQQAESLYFDIQRDALNNLYLPEYEMFRGHTGEIRYDAVDGIGLLSLVIIWQQTGSYPMGAVAFF